MNNMIISSILIKFSVRYNFLFISPLSPEKPCEGNGGIPSLKKEFP